MDAPSLSPSPSLSPMAEQLLTKGFCTVPCYSTDQTAAKRILFMNHLRDLPEFTDEATSYVYGGFAAISTASSQHHPIIRMLRSEIHIVMRPFFQAVALQVAGPELKLEQIVDRAMFRPYGVSASPDSVHRDECKFALKDDYIFGGWLNLDSTPQQLSCEPRSHLLNVNTGRGFAKITDKAERAAYRPVKIAVPPGHLLVFFENIMHDVCGKRIKSPVGMARLFLGWRLTSSNAPLIPDGLQLLDSQSLVPLKSGQMPRMYPTLAWTNWGDKLQQWTLLSLKPEYHTTRTYQSGKRKGTTLIIPQLYSSTSTHKRAKYEPYTASEKLMHTPLPLFS